MLDLLIRGAEVVDGTGAPRTGADVGVRDGRIVEVGRIDGSARRTVEADGLVLAPGFVDVHTHFDAQAFWDPTLSPSPLHGVTSVVGGNCGFSIAPLDPGCADYLMRMLARVEGMPLESLQAGVPWDWSSTAEYLDRLEGRLAVNAGFMVGHSAIRRVAMREAACERACTPDELDAMRALLRAGLRAGGMGFSTSRGPVHTDGDGVPVPSRHADDDELVALSAVCAEFPGTSIEFIPARHDPHHQELMVRMSLAGACPLNWNVMSVSAANLDDCLAKLEVGTLARESGTHVLGLVIPRASRSTRTFLTGFILDSFPGWAGAMALPPDAKLALLRDPDQRRRLYELSQQPNPLRFLAGWDEMLVVEAHEPRNRVYEGRRVAEIGREQGKAPFDALLDIVCDDGLRTTFRSDTPDETREDWEATHRVLTDPRVLIGGSDAGAHLDGLATFNYTTTLLQHLVREQGLMTLEEAVWHLTLRPARLYGLDGRGRIAPGAHADLVLLDPDAVASETPRTRRDLPAGAGRLYAGSTGIEAVFTAGEAIVAGGELTDARPGTVLRSGRDTVRPEVLEPGSH